MWRRCGRPTSRRPWHPRRPRACTATAPNARRSRSTAAASGCCCLRRPRGPRRADGPSMEQTGTSSRLTEAVQSLAADVVSALRGGDRSGVLCAMAGPGAAGGMGLAAVRVLASDALLPQVLAAEPADPADLAAFAQALNAY